MDIVERLRKWPTPLHAEAADVIEEAWEALRATERTIVSMYRAATPHGNYEDTESRFADNDPAVIKARATLAALNPDRTL